MKDIKFSGIDEKNNEMFEIFSYNRKIWLR